MREHIEVLKRHAIDFWLARAAVVLIVVLQLLVSTRVTAGPRWLAPIVETALLLPLSIATGWTHRRVGTATTRAHWEALLTLRRCMRWLALVLTAIISLSNFGSLVLLIGALLQGHAGNGRSLLVDAVYIWATNVIAFALWYWNSDRASPAARGLVGDPRPDFLFSNMTTEAMGKGDWTPGFLDYLFLSFTNSTALSPADTLPISQRAKMLMMFESCISLLTIAIVAARAVNILQ
ncbi:MAG: hypothetical protein E7812_07735 [Phenylobacterium sp.]|nr:MAG: hypothetical protein E7812_07735 [Phenylobacterium sp.]